MGCDTIVIDMHAGFQEKLCFWWMRCDIYLLWWMKLLSLFDLCCFKTWGVWISGMKEICMRGMRFLVDVAIDDFNWCMVMLIIMIILIWDYVVSKDQVNMNWCYFLWLCEYEMRLLFLLITSLRRDDVYVENDMKMECWLMLEMHWHVHVVYVHGGVHWPCRTAHSWGTSVVKESKHSLWGCLGVLICPWS